MGLMPFLPHLNCYHGIYSSSFLRSFLHHKHSICTAVLVLLKLLICSTPGQMWVRGFAMPPVLGLLLLRAFMVPRWLMSLFSSWICLLTLYFSFRETLAVPVANLQLPQKFCQAVPLSVMLSPMISKVLCSSSYLQAQLSPSFPYIYIPPLGPPNSTLKPQ